MKRSILAAALLGAATFPASSDIVLSLDSVSAGPGPYTWTYTLWGGLGDGPWFQGDSPSVLLYDIPGYIVGSGSFAAQNLNGGQSWDLADGDQDGDADNSDIFLTLLSDGGGLEPLGDAENGVDNNSDNVLDGQFYGTLTYLSNSNDPFTGLYDWGAGGKSVDGVRVTLGYVPITEAIPEASSVMAVVGGLGLGAGAWLRRRRASSK